LALGLIGAPPLAQAELSESPITPGFWSFANRKSETTEDVRAACRNYIEIRLPMVSTSDCEFTKRNPVLLCEKLGRSVAAHSIEKRRLNIVTKGSSNPMGQ
jgi:hypothetical protein